jgi:hypothetical protein
MYDVDERLSYEYDDDYGVVAHIEVDESSRHTCEIAMDQYTLTYTVMFAASMKNHTFKDKELETKIDRLVGQN